MNYIIFKTDGSILTQNPEYYIQQGNSGDEIFVGWEDADEDDIAIAVFILPNRETNTIAGIYDTKTIIVDEEERTFNGWTFTLTLDQTTYDGLLQMAIRINRNNQIVVSYPIGLIINETGVMPDTDSGVTIQELNSYLLQLERLSRADIDFYEFDIETDTLNTINERVGIDKVFAMSFDGEISLCVLKRSGNNFKLAISNPYGYYVSQLSNGSTIINNLQYAEFGVLSNNTITLNSVSGTLTTEQLERVKLGNCYIKLVSLNETLYLRPKTISSTSIHFENIQYNFNSQLSNYLFRKTYIDVTLADGTYTGQFFVFSEIESAGNKVTSLTSSSTDKQYPSAKAVFDALQNVIAVAEGKCKSYVLSNNYLLSEDTWSNYTVYDENGDPIATWADFQTLVGVRSLLNEQLKTQTAFNDTLSLAYVLTGSYPSFYFHRAENYFADAKTGDVLLVVEINVPDRWLEVSTNSITFNILETAKVVIANMVTTDTAQTITGVKTFSNGLKVGAKSELKEVGANFVVAYNGANAFYVGSTYIQSNKTFIPAADGAYDLGISSGGKWRNLYLNGSLYGATYDFTIDSAYKILYGKTINNLPILEYENKNVITTSIGTSITLRTPKTGCLPIYEGFITNISASAISFGFPNNLTLLTNDEDNVSVSGSILTIGAGVTIEFSLCDNKLVAINWAV